MGFWTVLGGILGIGSSIYQGMEQQNAIAEANRIAEEQAKAQYDRALKEWEIDFWDKNANFMWDAAKTEAARYIERQKTSDYNWRAQKMIEAAMANLDVNQQALSDRFRTEEDLRALQSGLEYGSTMDRMAAESGETVRQYMAGIRDAAMQSDLAVGSMQREQQELMSTMAFDQQKDQLGWEMNQIATLVDAAQTKAIVSARTGGAVTADRAAMNAAQKLGRAWGEMEQRSKARDTRVGLMNMAMRGETATQLGRIALSMQDQAEKVAYTANRYAANAFLENSKFKDLTIPSFQLAENQYGRELKALTIQTQNVLNEASMPYREAIIFDPVQPIKGLKPEYRAPTKIYEPSTAGIIGNAVISGIQGAMNWGSYTKSNGTLGWR